jgi:hypothetical protein
LPCLQLQANISKGRSTTRRGRCGGVEKWLFSDSIALRVDVDALHTTFFNNAAKVHDEYDLRATWGISIIWVRKGEAASSATWPVRRLSETSFQMPSA